MTRFYFLLTCLLFPVLLVAQQGFKPAPDQGATPTNIDLTKLNFRLNRGNTAPSNQSLHLRPRLNIDKVRNVTLPGIAGVRVRTDRDNGRVYALEGRPYSMPAARADKADAFAYLTAVAEELHIQHPELEIRITEERTDQLGQKHLRLKQVYQGLTVLPADARLHALGNEGFDLFTGWLQPSPQDLSIIPTISENAARTQVQSRLEERWINLPAHQLNWISGPQLEAELVVYAGGDAPTLAWLVNARPNLKEHASLFLDAHTGTVLHENIHTCGLDASLHNEHSAYASLLGKSSFPAKVKASLPDGPATANAIDLYDRSVTINTFSLQDQFLLVDGSRQMFTVTNGEISGIVLSYDGLSGSPQRDDFDPNLRASTTNTDWTRTEASVHDNAGTAYQYFLDKFGRNSIDGEGGDVISFMNINETDGTQMDNAFWNGRALFYGNGADAFQRLPRGLDVAGHEMAHGVIQSTADLVYEEESGAMNESFADIFGYLIEGETGDYRLGENVVTGAFPSGALRNLQNPNNGASAFGQRGWQPAHMDEFVNLPNTRDGDWGGVHINSGITNRAFYLFSSNPDVGDARAEQVYYRALDLYLTRSSRFADLRIAVVRAAGDLYGANVVAAANAAFDGVGIGGEAGDYTVDLETNEGDRFLLLANTNETALFLTDEEGNLLNNPLESIALGSRPSLTDDGQFAVFVDDDNQLRTYNFNTSSLGFIEETPQQIWRNVAISKDGTRIAVTTTDQDNRILIFDFATNAGIFLNLTNPTTSTSGISTGDVLYADALVWEPGGEFLMYDALSQLDDGLEFWDIGFLRAWDLDTGGFGDGNIQKLSNSLPEGISIGNPTFSKNSPYIIAFEEVDFENESYNIVGANIETGASATIFENSIVNYPNYGLDDDRMVFDAQTQGGDRVLAIVPIAEDKISPAGNATGLVNGGHWGYFFANGERDLNTSFDDPIIADASVRVFPTVTSDLVIIETGENVVNGNLEITDLSGRKVGEFAPTGNSHTELSIGHLSAGTYFLTLPTEAGTVVRRLFVVR